MADRWLVIGLGNPGPDYEKTRHNIGQVVLDQLSENQKFSSHKSRMQISEIKLDGQSVVLAKSLGYMNESGGPAKALADFYKIDLDKIIVIHDETVDRVTNQTGVIRELSLPQIKRLRIDKKYKIPTQEPIVGVSKIINWD